MPFPKGVLGVAAAAGGLLAVLGGIEGLRSHPSGATVKHEAGPILNPVEGGDGAATPTPEATSPSASPSATPGATSGTKKRAARTVLVTAESAPKTATGLPASSRPPGQ